jgi:GTP cyclohydrolase II
MYKLYMELTHHERQIVQIERACGDLRRGMPVCIKMADGKKIAAISPDNILFINQLFDTADATGKKLVISRTRAGYLFPDEQISAPVSMKIPHLSAEDVFAACATSPCPAHIKYSDCAAATEIEQSALKLAKIAELIPAVITFELSGEAPDDFLVVDEESITSYMKNTHYGLVEACRTPLTLANAPEAEIVAYRPNVGGSEHYAIIIGKIGKEPLVRVHSSCYTGDLLASLDCDCRDQLQSAIELMCKGDGGIILYLLQEGRGIGLVNKLRAYGLQDKGMDTVDANRALGFDDDERLFLPGAEILRKLGVHTVRLLTNNPRKAKGLEDCGIKVSSCVPHIMQSNEHNKAYLQTKVDRLGHKL